MSDTATVQPETKAVLRWEKANAPFFIVCVSALSTLLNACSSELVLATWACKPSSSTEPPDSGSADGGVSFEFPWSTGFENGFCDYFEGNGSCYTTGSASYKIVTAPVHSGHYAAAFTVVGDGTGTSTNSRCHRDGDLPEQAYYGAWYYIAALATNSGNWNLIHFQGGSDLHGLWDISLVNNADGGLHLMVADYVKNSSIPALSATPEIPIGHWFHIEMFLKRAADATGEVSVYQDDVPILQAPNRITDDTTYGQWYVGNLATDLNPAESTLYVDDVTVGATL